MSEEDARARVEALFAGFDRLTPDELARIGLRRAPDRELETLLQAIDDAAAATGRQALVDEARDGAREAVLRRYAAGTLHPTWVALNWGISQGTVEDRVAIVEALADAAAAAVVADALQPDVAEALELDAGQVVGLAAGSASEGALGRALDAPADPELGRSGAWAWLAAITVGAFAGLTAAAFVGAALGILAGVLVGVAVGIAARRARSTDLQDDRT